MAILLVLPTRGRLNFQEFDEAYLQRLKEGDTSVEQHFHNYFGELLLIKLRARLRSSQLIKDIRQETFLRVFRLVQTGGVHHPERLGALVNSICNNVMLEMLRAGGRHPQIDTDAPEQRDQMVDLEGDLLTEERKQQVRMVLERLPRKDRELLRAVFLEERDKDQICHEMGVDRNYLRVLVHRAKLQFRAKYVKATKAAG